MAKSRKKSLVIWLHKTLIADYKNALFDLDRGLWAVKNKPKNNEPFIQCRLTIQEL
jgi:hypothetical protein